MAGQVINVQPQVVSLALYAGDGFSVRLICTNSAGAPIDVTGAIRAQIRVSRADSTPVTEFAINAVDAYNGIIILSLTGAQTQDLVDGAPGGKFTGVWDIEWDSSNDEPRTLCQGSVECVADVSR